MTCLQQSNYNKFYIQTMSLHSSKYYHLIKTLRMQKHQSQVSKILKQREVKRMKYDKQQRIYTEQEVERKMDKDNTIQCDEKDRKMTIKLSKMEVPEEEYPRLWDFFEKQSLTKQIHEETILIQKKVFQKTDEKLIDSLLQQSETTRRRKTGQIQNLQSKIKKKEEEITQLKEKAIQLSLQLERYAKQFMHLKTNYDKEEKNINQRSTKYKQEKSKDIMIKYINKQDMEMRKAMTSKIKLNQELDLGFQIQRRRAFNQAKQAINQKKKVAQDKLNKIKAILEEHVKKQGEFISDKKNLENEKQIIKKEIIYFVKLLLKHFKNHSRGIQWWTNILHDENIQIKEEDLPNQLKKQDAIFLSSILKQVKTYRSQSKSKKQYASVNNLTPKSNNFKRKFDYKFNTQPEVTQNDLYNDKPERSLHHKHSKTTVYFDIENNNESSILQNPRNDGKHTFGINSKSLKKVYQNTGQVISKLIKNKNWNYDSCKIMPSSQSQHVQHIILEKKMIEEKIKQKFVNIRQKQRRNYMKKLLFGAQ